MNRERFRLIVAGGGTGGHFFPGLAVAQAVVALQPDAEVLFVGSARGIEARLAPRNGFPFKALPASGFASVGAAARVRALASVPAALALGLGTLLQSKPHAVLGVGGYASVPMGLAAGLAGIPLILLEQNVSPGLANRLLSRFAALVAVAFPQTKTAFRGKGRLLGNPVRASLTAVPPESGPERPFRLLVFGGSGGASALNAALEEALPALRAFPGGVEILHQTGEKDLERVRTAYEGSGIPARVEPFLHDMDRAYAWCHACVCRAGATTLAEIAAARRPALLVPFPHAAGGHQSANARGMEELGGAIRIEQADLTTGILMEALGRLAERTVRERMARALGKAARPDAARAIAEYVLLAGGRP
ncbi:MAG: undecaprenyldiphospho-muramoylpentapeptide beta-N-acetylglucosaminyltransferase [Acidobacteriota bacterium]